jgi:hypothetical protein
MAHCEVATQLYKKNIGQCKPLEGLCAMPKWVLANTTPLLQCTMNKNIPFHQQCGAWILILWWQHQGLCEWQPKWLRYGLAYSTQDIVVKDQYLKVERIVRHVSIEVKGGMFTSSEALSHWSITFFVPLNLDALPTSIIFKDSALGSSNTNNNWQNQTREWRTYG